MATDPQLRAVLLEKLGGVSRQRLSQRVTDVKRKYGPMSTEDATYVLAHMQGLDLTKYLDRDTVDRVRGMVPRDHANGPTTIVATDGGSSTRKGQSSARPVRIDSTVPSVNLPLSGPVSAEAEKMSKLYPKMYLLENSIRSVILRVMTAEHGKDWWTSEAPSEVRKTVRNRKDRESSVPWHGKRGAHEIYYTDFSDLRRIIVKNWDEFKTILKKQDKISHMLEDLEPARNTLAHHNPLSANEQKRLEVAFNDWAMLVQANRSEIP